MKPRSLTVLLFVALPAVSCSQQSEIRESAATFSSDIDHPYFALTPGTILEYANEDSMELCEVLETLYETREIAGVECTIVKQDVLSDDQLLEVTYEYFSQAQNGDVWKFGEETYDYRSGNPVLDPDSWIAGEEGMTAWLAITSDPKVDDVYVGYSPAGPEVFVVNSLTATEVTPAGRFENCLELQENPDDPEDNDIVIYSRGVGRVSERGSGNSIVLVRRRFR